jgi:hypothetical protein
MKPDLTLKREFLLPVLAEKPREAKATKILTEIACF